MAPIPIEDTNVEQATQPTASQPHTQSVPAQSQVKIHGDQHSKQRKRPYKQVSMTGAPQSSAVRAPETTPVAPTPVTKPVPAHVRIHDPNETAQAKETPALPTKPTAKTIAPVEPVKPVTPIAPATTSPVVPAAKQPTQPVQKATSFDKKEIHQILDKRLASWRPKSWEDDISRNTLDTVPFENVMPPCELPASQFEAPSYIKTLEPILDGKNLQEMIAKDNYAIPSEHDREGYSMGYDGIYWLSGLTDYLKIMEVAKRYNVEPTSYFDFGCATGRVLRHFAVQEEMKEVWGSDINGRHVRWLYENMPENVKPIFNHCIPTIPIPDNSVDIISAFSVFTHIDTFETCWLAELSRIMKDDGLCYLTVHNEDTWSALQKDIGNEKNRLIKSIFKIDPEMETKIHEPIPDTKTVFRFTDFGPYRAQVFHSNNYLQKVWGRYFKIEEILGCHHVRQTVLVLRKK